MFSRFYTVHEDDRQPPRDKCGSTINMCALDLTIAFYKMNHHGLFIKVMEKRIPVMLLRVIEHWFSIGNTCVK